MEIPGLRFAGPRGGFRSKSIERSTEKEPPKVPCDFCLWQREEELQNNEELHVRQRFKGVHHMSETTVGLRAL